MSNTQSRGSAHYASNFDARFHADSVAADAPHPDSGRHRATQADAVALELAQIRSRMDKLRQRMRSALPKPVLIGLAGAAGALIVLAVGSLASFVSGDGGLGMLLCGLFIVGVPLTAVWAVQAARPWWQLSHEAALLRQREKELCARTDPVILSTEGGRGSAGSADAAHGSSYGAGRGGGYGLSDESSSPTAGATMIARGDAEPFPLADYSALGASSHVLARAMQNTLSRSEVTARPAERESNEATSTEGESARRTGGLLQAAHARIVERAPVSTNPSWWSPTGLSERAIRHLAPAAREPRPIGGWGLLVVVGVLLTLFAIGVIAGVLTSG